MRSASAIGQCDRPVRSAQPGANGEIGFTALADAHPDGYTIGFINTPALQTNVIERQTKDKPDSFDPLVKIIDDPGAFVVHEGSEIKTLKDLQEAAKAAPNAITVGSTGVGSDDHLAMLLFQRIADVKLTHAPFPGSAPNKTALLGRHIAMSAVNIGEAKQAGEGAPDVPTFKEQGFDVISSSLRGIAAPKGLPPEVKQKLVDAILKAANDPEFQEKARQSYAPLRVLPPEQYAAEIKAMDEELRELWKASPWK